MRWCSAWSATLGGPGTLLLSAGADRQVAVDGLTGHAIEWATRLAGGATVVATTAEARVLLDRLVAVGALVPDLAAMPTVEIVRSRTAFAAIDALVERLATHVAMPSSDRTADLTIVVRTGDEWPLAPQRPHLGVDLTLHHTALIGPLVLPGVSACLRCLQSRTDHLWRRWPPPRKPRITRFIAAVADLIAIQIELAANSRSTLVNATIAWDLEQGTSDRQSVYKLPGCPGCGTAATVGRVHLPWAAGGPS